MDIPIENFCGELLKGKEPETPALLINVFIF